jgi:hypothetical protein
VFKGGLNARLNSLGVAPPKMEKGPKSAPKIFQWQFSVSCRIARFAATVMHQKTAL